MASLRLSMFLIRKLTAAVVQSLNHVWPCDPATPLSSTISWSLLRFMSVEAVMLSNHLFSIKLPNCFVFDGACPRHNCLQPGCPHEYFHLSHNEGNVNISVCLCLNVNFLLCLVHLLQATLSLWNIPDGLSFQQTYLFPKPLAHQNLGQRTGFFF